MPRVRTTPPKVSREKGQKGITYPVYLDRVPISFPYGQPERFQGQQWRQAVQMQPVCMDSREYLISSILDLKWKIEPKDSDQRDELKSEIEYYTDLLRAHKEYRFSHIIEWICQDLLDLPFGGVMEMGREGNQPNGRVLWFELLDGATCYPTLNDDFPIGQQYQDKIVYFPAHTINRIYYSPRTEIYKRGWGMAPPQKIYSSLELVGRGDVYYANLLLDTPPTGILDLVDMSKDSAEKWVEAWKVLLGNIDPYKIPVLYEHEKAAEWISFTKSPTEIMFDKAIAKYVSLVCAGYGISPSDINLGGGGSGGGDTMAGTIRQERSTRRNGLARLKLKLKEFFDFMLPPSIEFNFIDLDEETSVAIGRARLASSTAAGAFINSKMFSPQEMRLQALADGIVSVSVPENVPDDSEFPDPMGGAAERPSMMGKPVSPSSGGYGEVAARSAFDKYLATFRSLNEITLRRLMYKIHPVLAEEVRGVKDTLEDGLLPIWGDWYEQFIWGDTEGDKSLPELDLTVQDILMSNLKGEIELPETDELLRGVIDDIGQWIHELLGKENRSREIKGKSEVVFDGEIPTDKIQQTVSVETQKIPEYLCRAIVSATRRYVLLNETNFDGERIIDNGDCADLAYWYINNALNRLTQEFSQEISGIISEIVKGVLDGKE